MIVDKKLKESEMRYFRLFETAKDGILILDFETGNIIDANPFIIKIIGSPLKEILRKQLWEIGLFSNKEQSEIAFTELKKTGYIRFEDMPIQGKNGKLTNVEFISNVYIENKTKVIQCNIRDITERKLTEKALKESEEKFRSIMENSADAIFITGKMGKYLYTNNAVTDLLGYSKKEMKNKSIADIVPEKITDKFINIFNETLSKGKLLTEIELIKKDGNIISTDLNSVILPDGSVYSSCRDISKRKEAEIALKESEQILKKQNTDYLKLNKEYLILNQELIESLNQIKKINNELIIAKAKAEESDNLKSAFLANMSHEIRTPMNAIMGFSDFLLQPELSKEKIEYYVQIINASSLQLLSIINDVIDISKIESGQISFTSKLFNINNLMSELYFSYKKVVDLKKLNLNYICDHSNDFIQIKADENRIKQILCNILNNAIKFTKVGEIEFGFKIIENFVEFYVKDTGIGIAQENHTLIFERFRQLDSTSTRIFGGNGLGLSITKALVEKLGGTITVNSKPNIGSSFVFTIPFEKVIENTVVSMQINKSNQYNWNEKTILLVEDEVNNHAYIEELLSTTNVNILHAWDGKEAVEQVKNNSDISLVLMDIKMPIMDGYEATRLIKQIKPKLPVIAQTAYALNHDIESSTKKGFDNYISKPIEKNTLLKIINKYIHCSP